MADEQITGGLESDARGTIGPSGRQGPVGPAGEVSQTFAYVQARLAEANARVKEVSDEAKGYRLSVSEAKKATEAAEANVRAANDKIARTHQAAVRANLRVAAKEAGAVDASDMLALIPPDKMKINDDGDIENAVELLAELKKAKPYLFGAASTSSTAQPPKSEPAAAKKATEMTPEEFRAARAKLLNTR